MYSYIPRVMFEGVWNPAWHYIRDDIEVTKSHGCGINGKPQFKAMLWLKFDSINKAISVLNTPKVCITVCINTTISPWCNRYPYTKLGVVYVHQQGLLLPSAGCSAEHLSILHMATTAIHVVRMESIAFLKRLMMRDPCYFIAMCQKLSAQCFSLICLQKNYNKLLVLKVIKLSQLSDIWYNSNTLRWISESFLDILHKLSKSKTFSGTQSATTYHFQKAAAPAVKPVLLEALYVIGCIQRKQNFRLEKTSQGASARIQLTAAGKTQVIGPKIFPRVLFACITWASLHVQILRFKILTALSDCSKSFSSLLQECKKQVSWKESLHLNRYITSSVTYNTRLTRTNPRQIPLLLPNIAGYGHHGLNTHTNTQIILNQCDRIQIIRLV